MGTIWMCLIYDSIIFFLYPFLTLPVPTRQLSKELRLAGGKTVCTGRVEIYHNHKWGTVCDNDWDIADASIVCREVGCAEATAAPGGASFGEGSGPIWLDQVNCSGEEKSLSICPTARPLGENKCDHSKDAGVKCTELPQIRLANGPSRCAGRVEIFHENRWGTVCDDGWDLNEAKVVCRYLDCGPALMAPRGSHFQPGTGPIWLAGVKCTGSETAIRKCIAKVWGEHDCTHKQDAGVICAGPKGIRLVNGTSHCNGRVEVLHNQQWGTVCDAVWDLSSAQVVCRELGCGVALLAPKQAHFGRGQGPIWLKGAECKGTEYSLKDCQLEAWGSHTCDHGKDAGVVCSGRVEVLHDELWGTICDNDWSIEDAKVICKGLSCGNALKVSTSGRFGKGSGPVWLDEVNCEGTESSLNECSAKPWGINSCHHEKDVGVECADPMKVKLVNGFHRCSGRVEVFHLDRYGTVCDDGWDLKEATVICRHLDCGTAIAAPRGAHFGQGADPIWLDEVTCTGQESTLSGCLARPWGNHECNHAKDASVICSDNLRLVNGSNRCSGTVEVRLPNRGKWGTICDRTWDLKDAEVVCKELRCGKALSAPGGAHFGRGSGSVWVDNIHCKGTENAMIQCRASVKRNKCHHGQDAGAICSNTDQSDIFSSQISHTKVKLGDGPSRCSGRVELFHEEKWGTICDDGWNKEEANVICRQLDCGSAKSAPGRAKFGKGSGPIWLDDLRCSGTEQDISQCPARPWGENDCSHAEDAGVVCSEKEELSETTTTTTLSFMDKLKAELEEISENVQQIKEKQGNLEQSLHKIQNHMASTSTVPAQ